MKKTRSPLDFERRAVLGFGLGAVLLAGCSRGTPETRVVRDAAEAMGGRARIQEVGTLRLEGSGAVFALGQNHTLDGDLLRWDVTEYHRSLDFRNRRWRDESVRTPAFTTGWPDSFSAVEGYDRDLAYDVEEGETRGLDSQAARDRRAELYHHPLGFLQAAMAVGARLEPSRRSDEGPAVDLVPAEGERYTLIVNGEAGRPLRIVSTSHEPALGDVTVATEFEDFADADGLSLPRRMVRKVDDRIVAELRIARTVVNPTLTGIEAPADAQTASPAPARVVVDQVAPGVWYLTGEGHHSVLVEFADHLALIEAPQDDRRTQAVIGQARTLRPNKPLTQVINTHHHFDHSGGIRAAIAEGLTVITHQANAPFFERMAARPSTVVRDALARNPRPLRMETVSESKVLTDGKRRLEIYPITGSPHAATMLLVYLPAERLLVEADAYQPPPSSGPPPVRHPFAANLLENIEKRRLRVERILPIHGRMVPFRALVAAAGQRESGAAGPDSLNP